MIEDNHYPFSRCPYCSHLLSVFDKDALFCDNHGKVFEKDVLEKIYAQTFEMRDLLDDKEWLDYMYSYSYYDQNNQFIKRRGFSKKRIALALGVEEDEITTKLQFHNIPIRENNLENTSELYTKPDWLYDEYHLKDKNISEIAEEHNVTEIWITDRLEKMEMSVKISKIYPVGLIEIFERLLELCEDDKDYFICRGFLEERDFLQNEIELMESFLGALSLKDRLIRRKKGSIAGNWIGFFEIEKWNHEIKTHFCPESCPHKSSGNCRRLVGMIINAGILEQVLAFIGSFSLSDGRSEVAQLNRGLIKFRELNRKETSEFQESMERLKKRNEITIQEFEEKIITLKDNIQHLHNLKNETDDALGFTKEYFYEMFVDVKWGDKPFIEWKDSFQINSELYNQVIVKLKEERRLKFTFYGSLEWADVRNEILKRDKFTCQNCGHKPSRQVHHLSGAIFYPERCLDPENLVVLCDKCHEDWKKGGR